MQIDPDQRAAIIEWVDKILERQPLMPTHQQLWSPAQVATYLGVSKRTVAERYAARPDFPQAIRLPSKSGRGLLRWKAADVMRWADKR